MKDNKKKTTHSSSFGRLWSYLQVYRFPLYLAIFLKIISVIMSVIEPVVIGLAITELTKNTLDIIKGVEGAHINVSYVGLVLVFYLWRGLIYELASYYSNYFMTNAVQATVQDMRNEMTEKINRTSVSYFDKQQFGDLLGRFTSDVETVSNALQQSFLQVVNAVFTLALVIGTVLYLNLQLGAVVVITIPITYFGARFIMSKSQPYFKQQADALGTLNGFVQENLTGFNVLKLFGREDRSLDDFKEITEDLQKVGFKANFISGLMMPVLNGLSDLTYLIVAVLGGLQVLAGRLTIGNMQAFVQYVWQINQPIQNLTQLAGQLQSAKSSLDRIFQLMDEPDEANDATEVLEGELTGQVSFNHVDFQYVADKPLIRDFNLEVNPGEMVAIVGPTGAGKSTIINYLLKQDLHLRFSISATSRAPRGTEKNGVEYYFLTPEEFRSRIANGDFLEYEEVYTDKYYGTLKSEVERILNEGDNVIFDVDVVGGCNIKKFYGDRALSVFIQPPCIDDLRKRLEGRGTDSPEVIESRIAKAEYELGFTGQFDKVVVNDDLETAQKDALKIIREFLNK